LASSRSLAFEKLADMEALDQQIRWLVLRWKPTRAPARVSECRFQVVVIPKSARASTSTDVLFWAESRAGHALAVLVCGCPRRF
jgi:hypothetical protein